MMMRLEEIGFDNWFQEKLDTEKADGFRPARVFSVNKNSYQVSDGSKTVNAELTGKLLFNAVSPLDFPAVGDWVYAQIFEDQDLAMIHEIFPRKTLLKRKTAGKKVELQLLASNIDTALIVQSLDSDFNLRRLERYLVMVNESNIVPVVLLSKSDLLEADDIEKRKSEIHNLMPETKVIAFNSIGESELDDVKEELSPGKTYCLLGSSGVGKTTLINNLTNSAQFETKSVREKDGKGRHTTTQRQLIVLENGAMIIDTPGMRELGTIAVEAGLDDTFSEIAELAAQCRYNNCNHMMEDGCAVLAAVEDDTLSMDRYNNYLKLKKESEYNERSYLEKREKDKKFGKHCKAVMKLKKRERR